ncbi:MAG: type II secretion system F family protein [Halanaeroarchaeum sp.]
MTDRSVPRGIRDWLAATIPDAPDASVHRILVGIAVGTVLIEGILAVGSALGVLSFATALGTGVAVAAGAAYAGVRAPPLVRSHRRRTAVGAAPELMAYAVLQARLTPSIERATRFASDQTGGRLGRHLGRSVRAERTGRAGLTAWAETWADVDESLPRAVSLLVGGIESEPPARGALLDRALETVLTGSRERVATFATAVRGPATGIYAFGVLLPLAMVGLLPVAASAGVGVTPATIAVLYDGLLPLGLLGASTWLAARRPAVSRPPTGRDAIAAHRPAWRPLAGVAAGGIGALVLGWFALPRWSLWIVVPGIALGTALYDWFDPIRERRRRVATVERDLPDLVALVGHRLAAGDPIETAVASAADRLTGEVGAVVAEGDAVRRRLRVTVSEAFTGPAGPLASLSTPRTETAIALSVAAAQNGTDGGETLVRIAGYLRDLDAVEREARRELARTTDTLEQTALVFGPAIAGVTVALATGMGSLGETGTAVSVPALGVVVGAYVLALAVVLPSLAVVLERGLDVAVLGHRVGIALLTASVVYPVTVVAARVVVQV